MPDLISVRHAGLSDNYATCRSDAALLSPRASPVEEMS